MAHVTGRTLESVTIVPDEDSEGSCRCHPLPDDFDPKIHGSDRQTVALMRSYL